MRVHATSACNGADRRRDEGTIACPKRLAEIASDGIRGVEKFSRIEYFCFSHYACTLCAP